MHRLGPGLTGGFGLLQVVMAPQGPTRDRRYEVPEKAAPCGATIDACHMVNNIEKRAGF
jgi:hypothetical protein